MRFAVFLLVALVLLLLVGVLPAGEAPPQGVYQSPLFIALLGLLGISSLVCSVTALVQAMQRRHFKLMTLGFVLAHVSVILILVGALLRFVAGKDGMFVLPLDASSPISTSYDGNVSLDYGLIARDMSITYYEPTHYDLFVSEGDGGGGSHAFDQRLDIPEQGQGPQLLGENVAVDIKNLQDAKGDWVPFYQLPDGSILQLGRMVKHYAATIDIYTGSQLIETEKIFVNHPILHEKWRFYLMDAKEGQPFIVLSGKQDPGWPLVHVGLWMMMGGVAVLCFGRAGVR